MGLKVAIQMDPIGAIDIDADSTFRIAEEAQARGHSLFYYTPDRLIYREGHILARGWKRKIITRWAKRQRSIWPIGMWSGCVRIRPLIWAISPPPICLTASIPTLWW